jgi:hypothetical protein
MSLSSIKKELEKIALAINWAAILETAGYVRREVERLTSGEMLYEWVYEKNGVLSIIQTWSEDSPGIIMDWEHSGRREITKFDAILRLRCDGSFALAKTLLMEAVTLGDNAIDKIGRMNWRDYMQSSNEMAPEVLYYTSEVFQAQVDTELSNLISKEFAKTKFEELKFAQEGEQQPSQTLKEFLGAVFSASKWIIEGLFPVSGKVFLAAKAKAGKTTLVTALLKCLADGGDFLGKFKVSPHKGRIGYMNMELTEIQMQEWLQRQNIMNIDKIHLWNLRGKVNPFRSEVSRRALIAELQEQGIETLVIDTFAKIFTGSNADNNSEVNRFLIMLDSVLDQAGVEQLVMLVHAGNDAKKIRGATALTDHPDGIWFLFNDEDKNRYFSAIGRDIELDEGQIIYDKALHTLEFTGTGKKATRESSASERMLAFIRLNQGANASAVDESVGGTKASKIRVRTKLVKDGLVEVGKGPNNSNLYFTIEK